MKPSLTRNYKKKRIENGSSSFLRTANVSYQITNLVIGTVANGSALLIGTSGGRQVSIDRPSQQ